MRFLFPAALAMMLASGAAFASAPGSTCDSNAQNQVQNCGFETGDFTDWTVSGSAAVLAQNNLFGVDAYNPNSGTYSAYFGTEGATPGTHLTTDSLSLAQNIALTESLTYTVSFYLSQDTPVTTGYTNYFAVTWDGATEFLENAASVSNYTLVTFTVTGSASGANTLAFLSQNDAGDWNLDDISVVEVPEPASIAAFGLGLAGLGWAVRRRRRRAA